MRKTLLQALALAPVAIKGRLTSALGRRLLGDRVQADQAWLGRLQTNFGIANGLRLTMHPRHAAEFHWFGRPERRPGNVGAIALFAHLAPQHDWLIDVGAHLGVYGLTLGARFAHLKVLMFEAAPELAAVLAANAGRLDGQRIRALHQAVASSSTTLRFYVSDSSEESSLNPTAAGPHATAVEVDAVALSDVYRQYGIAPSRSLLKVDVEDAEPEVIAGAAAILGEVPYLVIELLGPARKAGMVTQLQRDHGFHAYYIDGTVLRASPVDTGYWRDQEWNWLFCRHAPDALRASLAGSGLVVSDIADPRA